MHSGCWAQFETSMKKLVYYSARVSLQGAYQGELAKELYGERERELGECQGCGDLGVNRGCCCHVVEALRQMNVLHTRIHQT